ncbi:MAG: UDP-N-acetylmuramoyl-L-alanyl-D-glutamate--2,6-diaminopimelate ligase, partial [Schaalia georgiae]|nr:UDP-N-acetylmuramoyl-L-alanyl-D-glutamate--2,6-diaminopimelate ligase [Schaalia georgiae]
MTDIRPSTSAVPLAKVLPGSAVRAVYGPDGAETDWAELGTRITGVTVSSDDCEPQWLFVAIPGLSQHGIRFAHAAKEAGAVTVLTDAAGAVTWKVHRGLTSGWS